MDVFARNWRFLPNNYNSFLVKILVNPLFYLKKIAIFSNTSSWFPVLSSKSDEFSWIIFNFNDKWQSTWFLHNHCEIRFATMPSRGTMFFLEAKMRLTFSKRKVNLIFSYSDNMHTKQNESKIFWDLQASHNVWHMSTFFTSNFESFAQSVQFTSCKGQNSHSIYFWLNYAWRPHVLVLLYN